MTGFNWAGHGHAAYRKMHRLLRCHRVCAGTGTGAQGTVAPVGMGTRGVARGITGMGSCGAHGWHGGGAAWGQGHVGIVGTGPVRMRRTDALGTGHMDILGTGLLGHTDVMGTGPPGMHGHVGDSTTWSTWTLWGQGHKNSLRTGHTGVVGTGLHGAEEHCGDTALWAHRYHGDRTMQGTCMGHIKSPRNQDPMGHTGRVGTGHHAIKTPQDTLAQLGQVP